jgi:hypothetical protein
MNSDSIRTVKTIEPEIEKAIAEIASSLKPSTANYSIIFFRPDIDLAVALPFLTKYFGNRVAACSSAGQLSGKGYEDSSIVGLAFSKEEFLIQSVAFSDLDQINTNSYSQMALKVGKAAALAKHDRISLGPDSKSVGLLLIDGLCGREELVTNAIFDALENIPLVGGSAGDGLRFQKTQIVAEGRVLPHGATLLIVTTKIAFKTFKIQHFTNSGKKMVITRSDPRRRIVYEIDGESAATCYARFLGLKASEFSPSIYSQHPLLLKIQGDSYVRSIQSVNPDGSLTFYCAIEDGLVLSLANKKNLYEETKSSLRELKRDFSEIYCSLFFECILRRIEVMSYDRKSREQIFALYREMNPIGFHSYGEQFDALHVNQTLTGVVFGKEG